MSPVVDFGGAIGLVYGFLLDVLLHVGRGIVGGGDHVPCSCLEGRLCRTKMVIDER